MAELEAASAEEVSRRRFLSGLIAAVAGIVGFVVAIPADRICHFSGPEAGCGQ